MKVVKFVASHSPYAPGDVAGLSDKEAEAVIKAKKAVAYTPKKAIDEAPEDKMVKSPGKKK